jgi:hypothetical protein
LVPHMQHTQHSKQYYWHQPLQEILQQREQQTWVK